MSKYEVYKTEASSPLTVVEADEFEVDYDKQRLVFRTATTIHYGQKHIVALFNWNNISGFKEIESEVTENDR